MTINEARNLRDTHFNWKGRKFPKTEKRVLEVWVVPKEIIHHEVLFLFMDGDDCKNGPFLGFKRDECALQLYGHWRPEDEFTIMFLLENEDRSDSKKLARDFILEEGLPQDEFFESL